MNNQVFLFLRFICDTRGAGAGQLTVRIRGPKGEYLDFKISGTIFHHLIDPF